MHFFWKAHGALCTDGDQKKPEPFFGQRYFGKRTLTPVFLTPVFQRNRHPSEARSPASRLNCRGPSVGADTGATTICGKGAAEIVAT